MNIFGIAYVVIAIGLLIWWLTGSAHDILYKAFSCILDDVDVEYWELLTWVTFTAAAIVWPLVFAMSSIIHYGANRKKDGD